MRDSKTNHSSTNKDDFVAQLVEQLTLNQWVESSSLSEVTKQSGKTQQIAETKTVSAICFNTPIRQNREHRLKMAHSNKQPNST